MKVKERPFFGNQLPNGGSCYEKCETRIIKTINNMNIYDTTFKHDWNTREGQKVGKLQCSHFTTVRMYGEHFKPGTIHRIWNNINGNKKESLGYAVVVKQMPFQVKDFEKWDVLCRLDTGYGHGETKGIVLKIYKGLTDESWLNFVLFRFLTKAEIVRMTEKLKAEGQTTIPLT